MKHTSVIKFKNTFMRKLFSLVFLIGFAVKADAQAAFSLTTPPCHNNGILAVTFPSTLTPPLTVSWYTGGTTGTVITHTAVSSLSDVLTGYSGGPVNVYATDIYGVIDGATYAGAPPFTVALSSAPAVCPAPDTAFATVTGGTAPYSYVWYNIGTSAVVGTGSTVVVPTGNYGVTVTDAAGCIYGSMVDYIADTLVSIPTFSVAVSATTAGCTNGTATAITSGGGMPPFTYSWTNGAATATISGLVNGNYGVTVTDAVGCSSGPAYAFVPQSITVSVPLTPTPATCAATDGVITSFATGGTAPYTYVWSNGGTTATQTGLPAGQYNVIATDANGCIGSSSVYLGVSTPITVTYSTTPSLCLTATGTATLNLAGGSLPYSVLWYTAPAQTGTTATNLPPGNYSFKVTDGAGCEQTGTVVVPPVDVINATFSATNALCTLSNGSLTVFPTGGVSPYTYTWSTGSTTAGISSVPAGTYSVTVRDNLGCKVTFAHNVPVNSPVGVGLYPTPASCVFSADGSISAVAYGGTPPYAYGWSGGGTSSTLGSLSAGFYTVRVTDASGCAASNSTSLGYNTAATSCYCTIAGTIFNDLNGNCIQDAGEPGIPKVQVGCSGIGYTYTDANGHYSFIVPAGSYTISETLLSYLSLPACQPNNIPVATAAGSGCIHTINFANAALPVHDLHISTWNYSRSVPGNTYTQALILTNDGSINEDTSVVHYKTDGQFFTPAFTPSGIFTGASNLYSAGSGMLDSLVPGASQVFYLGFPVPGDIPLNTSVVFKDTIAYNNVMGNWLTDNTPANNVSTLTNQVGTPYDPNFKSVSPQGSGPTGIISYTDSVLEYMVHFQNVGTAAAQNVVVVDTLDDNLDWTSLKPVYQSAPCKILVSQSGSRKVAKFTFNNINLPPQIVNDLSSNGMFTYTIKTRPGLALGSTFRNKASVYFDFNAPIVTNSTINTLGSVPSSVVTTTVPDDSHSFTIYPNPAGNSFNAIINNNAAATGKLSVADVSGKLLIVKAIDLQKGGQTISADVSMLTPGIYFVTLNVNGNAQTQKLVIIR
jgi:uncharacterized repeat protein (TIGR01451 family)